MNSFKDIGIVLNTADYKDSDKLVSLLCKESGRILAIARGVKRSKRRFAGGIDIFDCARISISSYAKSKDRFALEEFTICHTWNSFRSSLNTLSFAALCTEAIAALTIEHDPDSKLLFNVFFLSLKALDESSEENQRRAIASYLILHAMNKSGFATLEEESELQPGLKDWLLAMLAEESPIVPKDSQLSELGLKFCVKQLSELTGKRLNSWDSIKSIS